VHDLADLLKAWPDREFNIEGNPFHNLMDFVREVRPHQVTFVPDSEDQFTSDHGWTFPQDAERLKPLIDEAKALGARVSLFMDPIPEAMTAAKAVGADRVELYTETYASAYGTPKQAEVLAAFKATAEAALKVGLGINAGHDLNRDNLHTFLTTVPGVQEVSIGHALIADALELGYTETVRAYNACMPR
jgi:pyridoxine 5-phosphate synthase